MARSRVIDRDRGWAAMRKALDEAAKGGGSHVKVGILGEHGGDATHDERSGATNLDIGIFNEFGTQHAPERSFLRSTFDRMREELAGDAAKLAGRVVDGVIAVEAALGILGAKLTAEVKKAITVGPGIPPPNAPATVRAKGSDRPLVNHGKLLAAITWAVVSGKPPER